MSRLFGKEGTTNAAALAQALGGLKGPIMKVAQLLATVPDLLPPEYVADKFYKFPESPEVVQTKLERATTAIRESIHRVTSHPHHE